MNDSLTKLSELLKKLPGIGPRQARRLAFWFVRRDSGWIDSFARVLLEARANIKVCSVCKRLHPEDTENETCSICGNDTRDKDVIMLVEKDVDLENIERTGAYKGVYFVLGGTTSPLDKEPERKIRIRSLVKLLENESSSIKEVIFALSATPEGEDTIMYIEDNISKILEKSNIKVSKLARGLSTGTELEYVDKDTMTYALKGRE